MGEDLSLDRPRGHPNTDAVGRRPQRRLLRPLPERLVRPVVMTRSVRREEGQRPRAASRPELAAALVREPRAHAAQRAGDRHRQLLGRRRRRCPAPVLAHRFDAPTGSMLLLHNLADTAVTVDIGPLRRLDGDPYDLLVDGPYDAPTAVPDGAGAARLGLPMDPAVRSDQG